MISRTVGPILPRFLATVIPAFSSAFILSPALPLLPEIIAPAWPILLPGGAVRVVVNREWARGLAASLRLGLRSASPRAAAAAVLLGDQPRVSQRLIDRVAAAFLAARSPAARPVYTGSDGRRVPGHPVFLARRIWAELKQLGGDRGAGELLCARPDWLLEVAVGGEPPADIDTWEDYQRAGGAGPAGRG